MSTNSIDVDTERTFKLYSRRRLFDAVAQGDTSELDDLLFYLLKTLKHLTDNEFKGKGDLPLLSGVIYNRKVIIS